MRKGLIAGVVALFTLYGCNKFDCHDTYTISGKMLNGTTNQPIVDGVVILAYLPSSGGAKGSILGQSKIDSIGNFSISYPCQQGGAVFLSVANYTIYVPTDNGSGNEIPLNQSMNQTWTAAQFGWLKIYLNPQNPLGLGDTFYVTMHDGIIKNYTIIKNQSGILDSFYLPASSYYLQWGIGNQDFLFGKHNIYGNIKGDPYVTNATINY